MNDDEFEVMPKMKRGGIGAMQNNVIKDKELTRKVLSFNLRVMQMGIEKPKTIQELQDRFTTYFEMCVEEGLPPTVEGLGLCSGWTRQSFWEVANGDYSTQFTDTIKKAKDYIQNYDASMATMNKVNAAVYCFRAKNFYDMKDVQEIKAGPLQDATKPQNEQDIINAMPELPENSSASPIVLDDIGKFEE